MLAHIWLVPKVLSTFDWSPSEFCEYLIFQESEMRSQYNRTKNFVLHLDERWVYTKGSIDLGIVGIKKTDLVNIGKYFGQNMNKCQYKIQIQIWTPTESVIGGPLFPCTACVSAHCVHCVRVWKCVSAHCLHNQIDFLGLVQVTHNCGGSFCNQNSGVTHLKREAVQREMDAILYNLASHPLFTKALRDHIKKFFFSPILLIIWFFRCSGWGIVWL